MAEENEKLNTFWEEHNSRINTIIGKLSVPAMTSGDPGLKAIYKELMGLAIWVDEQMEAITEG